MDYLKVALTPKEYRRIFKKVSLPPNNDCWEWKGCLDELGYGLLWYRGRTERSHRIIYAFFKGQIPKGKNLTLDHLCRNRKCCNPKHLELVSHRENVLRGVSPPAINSKKTHCKNGHTLSPKKRKNSLARIYCLTCDSLRHKKRINGPKREYWLKKANEATKRWYSLHKKK